MTEFYIFYAGFLRLTDCRLAALGFLHHHWLTSLSLLEDMNDILGNLVFGQKLTACLLYLS